MSRVSQLYDTLFSFESTKHKGAYPIHKKLALGEQYPDLLDWLMDKVNFSPDDRILDAGCGTGYSLLKLAQELGLSGKGISLAEREVTFARDQADQMELCQQVEFEVGDFKHPIAEKYDKILAVESIKHATEIECVISNLVDGLAEGGVLMVVDDFLEERGGNLIEQHKTYWQVPGFDHRNRTVSFLEEQDLTVRQFDFTSGVPRRSGLLLTGLLAVLRIITKLFPQKHRMKIQIYMGGLQLEQLYNQGKVGYYVLLATKKR